MNKKQTAAALASALIILSGSAFAQNTGLIDAAKLDGQDVYDFHGKKLGDIKQVLVDPVSGRARYAVVQVDKAWDLNDAEIAVPWTAFKIARKADKGTVTSAVTEKLGQTLEFTLDATKEKLSGATPYKVGDADRLFTQEAGTPIYKYWGIWWVEEPTPPAGKP